ncbi:DEAD/DEAH box helicase [Lentisphaera profundi]|uniref:DEAD/DEAH box helicase n=1 Tax=Lentisphaera profundi TaxID=1658616 RepID=A0ABY7VUY0_9BACT|nr:DEAD/DEAH box helicase [Lentisphaera profundi]WDE97877.1 DEAD/DEAH box helicase [Lentisphaera profundi]
MQLPDSFPSTIQSWLNKQDFEQLLPIQELVVEHSNEEKQLIISSPTGSGKTIAFLIPVARKLLENPKARILILSPSPELAMQNIKVIRDILPQTKATAVISGVSTDRQKDQLKKRPQIISATPGRLRDFMLRGIIKPQDFNMLIIDEIDALLREGIENLVAELMELMPPETHECIVASATVIRSTEELLNFWRPEFFLIENTETAKIKHAYIFTNPNRRDICLMKLIRSEKIKKAIIFVNSFEHTRHALKFFEKNQLKAAFLEAAISKTARAERINDFKNGKINFLITTDLLSRGFDCKDSAVIHYHCPITIESFKHRSGRTARGSQDGANYLVVTEKDLHYMGRFEKKMDFKFEEINLARNFSPKPLVDQDAIESDASTQNDETATKPKALTDSANPVKKSKTKPHNKKTKAKAKLAKVEKKEVLKKKPKHNKRKGKPGSHKKKGAQE